jgi:hypothetical protein
MTAQCQAQHGLRADRFQAYFLARKVRRNYFPHVSTVMWPSPLRSGKIPSSHTIPSLYDIFAVGVFLILGQAVCCSSSSQ